LRERKREKEREREREIEREVRISAKYIFMSASISVKSPILSPRQVVSKLDPWIINIFACRQLRVTDANIV
jgi:hypothetical protein